MTITAGSILISMPSIDDPNFEETVIFITECNEKGAMGFVLNKLFARTLNELEEFKNSKAIALYDGGPVEKDHLYFIHQRSDLIEDGTTIADAIYLGGNFKQAITHLNNKTIQEDDIKIFIGYCGWDPLQLEDEVREGSWLVVEASSQTIFSTQPTMLWNDIYEGKK
jgi:putative transcriptional regulator